eukprot:CAMPEP_0202443224 /NCGR_PEP_ID=MMETSP1360-20130828/2573_1 /ASSEMBLY_ACC=CAM_ASM_000848 /TAXON_ID=515479 /ORGANISM="Licmophora paradoxa, Strain CCMP2313" /LENGTH=148 /DNA_ID=CAMNT_0049058869 /DNA_START=79 /DNA_END=525 /DNA_ORIENTATION=+
MRRVPLRSGVSVSRNSRRWGSDMPRPQSMDAELWQGHPKHKEGWENILYATYGTAAILITIAVNFTPETSIQAWAEQEARARLALPADTKLEFGTHYQTSVTQSDLESQWEAFNMKAIKPGEDDDDDDDDDDDEDDEEEEDDDDDDDE